MNIISDMVHMVRISGPYGPQICSAFSYSERSRTEANFRERSLLNARFAANVREPKRPVSGGSSL